MADIINLRRARKAKAREAGAAAAAANRAAHGRSKVEVLRASAERARRDALLDGARRDGTSPGEPT